MLQAQPPSDGVGTLTTAYGIVTTVLFAIAIVVIGGLVVAAAIAAVRHGARRHRS